MRAATIGAALLAAVLTPLSACTQNPGSGSGDPGLVTVSAKDDACAVSAGTAPAGKVVFRVSNAGSKVTEFYLYDGDGKRILGEVENIGPGLTRDLVVKAAPGRYLTACKPGMTGDGIRAGFRVTGSAGGAARTDARQRLVDEANAGYRRYVRAEAGALLGGTRAFVRAYQSGRDDRARHLYPRVRTHWERIEPVAESFGDLDPRMDAREADLEQGQAWTGWHRLEKDLWPPAGYRSLPAGDRAGLARRLLADTVLLHARVQRLHFSEDQVANGAKELMDEVATGKVTGEEEVWSHTDLFDFQANVDGAAVAFDGLRPVLEAEDPALARQLDQRFADLQRLLDRYRTGPDGFVSYSTLGTAQVKRLSDSVNALSEPLSRMTAAVVA